MKHPRERFRLLVEVGADDAPAVITLRRFLKITTAGNETFESWREREHDDLVLSVALACWLGMRPVPYFGFAGAGERPELTMPNALRGDGSLYEPFGFTHDPLRGY